MTNRLCIFCFRWENDPTPFCPDNPGNGCTYGCAHEYPASKEVKPKQPKKIDLNLCLKCGVHKRNPASATNGCAHEYSTGELQ